jgi:MFS superfamily sulfate permease-like transporter
VRATIAAAKDPVEWFLVDASSINVVDLTAFQKIDELREELAAAGIVLAVAFAKPNLWKFFNQEWALKRRETHAKYRFDTINTAVRAFNNRVKDKAPEYSVT